MPEEDERPHRLFRVRVDGLWGETSWDLRFHPTVNVIIGPNGSGKTTLINLIRYVLTGDIPGLARMNFQSVQVQLKPFGRGEEKEISVSTTEEGFLYESGTFRADISVAGFLSRRFVSPRQRHEVEQQAQELRDYLAGTVPAVWLPVTRRLPTTEEDDDVRRTIRRGPRIESVDERLDEIISELSRYRIRLDALLAQEYKRFEREVLGLILYREEYANISDLNLEFPTEIDKQQLLKAFREADLLDRAMAKRIDEHFEASKNAAEAVATQKNLDWKQVMVLPLIPRTKEMVRLATALEERRKEIFAPLRRFEGIVNGFLNGKEAAVSDQGELVVTQVNNSDRQFKPDQLSSGEKQLFIMLIEALLREGRPVVYVADEPELSLHVEWQEKLLPSLMDLAREAQLVVATHSPDIVGEFQDHVIRLEAR